MTAEKRNSIKPVAAAIGTALLTSLALGGTASAASTDLAFGAVDLDAGFMLAGGDQEGEG